MVTTTFNNFGSVQIDLPSSTIQQTDKNKSIEIIIDKDGNYHISQDGKITQVQFSDLDAYLKSAKEATVSADKNLKYQTIMDVITKIKENGVDNLGLTFYELGGTMKKYIFNIPCTSLNNIIWIWSYANNTIRER